MPDETRAITDDMPLSELTVGEFKALMQSLLADMTPAPKPSPDVVPEPQIEVKRQSLDDFMNDLSSKK